MKHLWPLVLLAVALSTQAAYIVEPDIAKEYLELRREVLAHPDSATVNFEYAICLAYMGKVEDGRATLRKVKRLDPDFAKQALPRYLQQYHEDPRNPRVMFRLGFLYYFNDQYDNALAMFDEVAKHQPVGQLNAWALGYMAAIRGDQKKWDEAEQLVRRALAIEPDAYALHAALAAALRGQGRYLAAMGEFLTALQKRSDFQAYEQAHFPASGESATAR